MNDSSCVLICCTGISLVRIMLTATCAFVYFSRTDVTICMPLPASNSHNIIPAAYSTVYVPQISSLLAPGRLVSLDKMPSATSSYGSNHNTHQVRSPSRNTKSYAKYRNINISRLVRTPLSNKLFEVLASRRDSSGLLPWVAATGSFNINPS